MPANETRPPTDLQETDNQKTIDALKQETVALGARICLKLVASPERQEKMTAIARQALLGESGKGLFKRISVGLALRLMPRMMNMLTKKVPAESPAPDIGRLLTTLLIIQNRSGQSSTTAGVTEKARRLADTVDALLSNLDLGELYEVIENGRDKSLLVQAILVDMILEKHLGKMASLAPIGVAVTNSLLATLNNGMQAIYDAPPDFVAGALAGLIDMLDGDALGELLNHQNEVVRMLHIGDLLQGDGKITALEGALTNKSREVFRKLDPALVTKNETGRAEVAATIKKAKRRALAEYPELTRAFIAGRALAANAQLKTTHETMKLLAGLPEETAAQSLADALGSINTYELAESISQTLLLLKAMREHQPGVIGKWLANIVKSLDDDELATVSEMLTAEIVGALKPLAASFIPSLMDGLCDLLAESLDDEPAKTGPALSRLLGILQTGQSADKTE